ncbi:ChaN family lipoprotein [Marinobacterium weihaiense]|uniref:ChaN family lipoprotein n=1 Tax=Marinobacterium weihaiense TaxID=2851016 RepID=A0ABS6M819_9GAMM|nr:ChaN family lipoprotein [Marinobacterium weihaiense]MBV0932424.1 ChaN family lipoprotein [Marinobacterium weihaiense]
MKTRLSALLMLLIVPLAVPLAHADATLEGRLWSVAQQQFVSQHDLLEQLPRGGWVLLGEQHDHPEHHRIQADWIQALSQRDQLGAVALEMADHSQQRLLDAALGRDDVLPEALQWQPGWPWRLYGEVVNTALARATAVVGADLTRDEQRQAYAEGAPRGDLGESHAVYMRDLLFESHCGQLPRQSLNGMRQVQLARDQQMAAQLIKHQQPQRIGIMLTGTIHARRDLGIPRWLQQVPALSILMIPVDNGTDPLHYVPNAVDGLPPADYLLFTTALPVKDYCAELAAQGHGKG